MLPHRLSDELDLELLEPRHARELFALTDRNLRLVAQSRGDPLRRSRAIPERLGYTLEGTIRQAEWLYDHFVDHVVYGLLASDELR